MITELLMVCLHSGTKTKMVMAMEILKMYRICNAAEGYVEEADCDDQRGDVNPDGLEFVMVSIMTVMDLLMTKMIQWMKALPCCTMKTRW